MAATVRRRVSGFQGKRPDGFENCLAVDWGMKKPALGGPIIVLRGLDYRARIESRQPRAIIDPR
jgi:hypothetical protein